MTIPIRKDGPPKDRTYRPPAPKTESAEQYRERHNFYCRKPWLNLRALKLRQSPFCEECLKSGIYTPADSVHHVIDIDENPSLMLTLSNLASVCRPCHSSETTRRRMSQRKE